MNDKEINYLLTILKAEYENSFKDPRTVFVVWKEAFANDDYNLTLQAVKRYITNNTTGFKPTIGQIKDLALQIKKENWHKEHDKVKQIEAPKDNVIPMPDDIRDKLSKIFNTI